MDNKSGKNRLENEEKNIFKKYSELDGGNLFSDDEEGIDVKKKINNIIKLFLFYSIIKKYIYINYYYFFFLGFR